MLTISVPLDISLSEINKLRSLIDGSRRILITGTADADGDSIGAQLALYELLMTYARQKRIKLQIDMFSETPCPEQYAFLTHSSKIVIPNGSEPQTYDMGFVCDGGVERTGEIEPFFKRVKCAVLVDHHDVGSTRKYNILLFSAKSSSTCEIVFDLIESGVFGVTLSKTMAEALYLGEIFDTGFFKHSITRPKSYLIAAKLIATGIDFSQIARKGILEKSPAALKLLAAAISTFESHLGDRVGLCTITRQMFEACGATKDDREGIINHILNTRGIEVACIISETDDNRVAISFRSTGGVNVAEVSRGITPSGGGHARAAGCKVAMDKDAAKKLVLERLAEKLK